MHTSFSLDLPVWIFNEVVNWFIGLFMKQCFKGTDGVQPRLELLASIQLSNDSTRPLIVVVIFVRSYSDFFPLSCLPFHFAQPLHSPYHLQKKQIDTYENFRIKIQHRNLSRSLLLPFCRPRMMPEMPSRRSFDTPLLSSRRSLSCPQD